jgi:hypothetical protein
VAGDFAEALGLDEVWGSRFQPPKTKAAFVAAARRWSLSLLSFSERATTMPPMQSPAIAIAVSLVGCVVFFTARPRTVTIALNTFSNAAFTF